ncbi:hypothetical protein LSH36_160g01011 [Paralvinella palmiformis]|uniref:Uncharacterized protein n=1 Tax=Paralvinella palmiformis TaxID=53620 RepID=A0AAD9N9G2_9ANNE|nr:hypothetical protein LSH36_160g01011 [Paralvinella palmiformis]
MYGIIIQLFLLHIYLRYTSCNLHVNQTFTRTDPGSFGSQKHYQSVTLSRGKVTCGAICGHCFSCVGIGIAESDVVNCFLIFRNSTLNCLSTDRMTPTAPFQTLDSVIYFILEKESSTAKDISSTEQNPSGGETSSRTSTTTTTTTTTTSAAITKNTQPRQTSSTKPVDNELTDSQVNNDEKSSDNVEKDSAKPSDLQAQPIDQ